jgi:S-layer protein (TIGR01564 family)
MKPRQVEAAVGLFLVCIILTGTAAQEIPLDFFINQETGEPNVLIVVGTTAASEDMISATKLAAIILIRQAWRISM